MNHAQKLIRLHWLIRKLGRHESEHTRLRHGAKSVTLPLHLLMKVYA